MDDKLTETVIGAAMTVHRELGPGFLESVYGNALAIELEGAEISFKREVKLDVSYRGKVVGEFRADFLVESDLIVEIKAIETLLKTHEVQTVNYLAATGFDIALLNNFGAPSLQFKRKHRIYTPSSFANESSAHDFK